MKFQYWQEEAIFDRSGYISLDKIGKVIPLKVNVREKGSGNSSIIGKLERGNKVKIVGITNSSDWYFIKYGTNYDKSGYVSAKLLQIEAE